MDVKDKAPDFILPDEDGQRVALKDFRGQNVVVYFFPRADTPQAQKKFKQKYDLPFTLLADTDKKVAKLFDVIKEKNMYGKKVMGIVRTTFVIDENGMLAAIYPKVKVDGHVAALLSTL